MDEDGLGDKLAAAWRHMVWRFLFVVSVLKMMFGFMLDRRDF